MSYLEERYPRFEEDVGAMPTVPTLFKRVYMTLDEFHNQIKFLRTKTTNYITYDSKHYYSLNEDKKQQFFNRVIKWYQDVIWWKLIADICPRADYPDINTWN
jgi:hypothetical protein